MALVVVAGDPDTQLVPPWWQGHRLDTSCLVVAADGGLELARSLDFAVDAVIGDMDSVDPLVLAEAEAAGATVLRASPDKDETDLELAIDWALRRDVSSLVAIGGGGGRLDHLLGNVAALSAPRLADIGVEAWMGEAFMGVVRPGRPLEVEARRSTVVSILPQHGSAHGVETHGLRWPLLREDLPAGSCRGLSNEVLGSSIRVELATGCLAVVVHDATDLIIPCPPEPLP